MVKIRLVRGGVKNDPFYRIVAIDERKKSKGRALDKIGHWHPAKNEKSIDKKKLSKWLQKGAQMTKAVRQLINHEETS
jgi:small subunit ribosomal protein S16